MIKCENREPCCANQKKRDTLSWKEPQPSSQIGEGDPLQSMPIPYICGKSFVKTKRL